MKILTSQQVRLIDQRTIKEQQIESHDLMERAGIALTAIYTGLFSTEIPVLIICGPGNNGGDGLVMARLLNANGYKVVVWRVIADQMSPDHKLNYGRLLETTGVAIQDIKMNSAWRISEIDPSAVIIDALFGSGLSRPIEGELAQNIESVNTLANEIVAIDVPSGLRDEGPAIGAIVNAAYTFAIEIPRFNFFLDDNYRYIGEWTLVDIGLSEAGILEAQTSTFMVDEELIAKIYLAHTRSPFDHKGTYGHALLACGSEGMMGAAVLCTESCLRSGAGKVTVHVPQNGRDIIHMACPEAMVRTDDHQLHITRIPDLELYDAIGIGCGLGRSTGSSEVVDQLLTDTPEKFVIDADALNIIADKKWLKRLPSGSVITPHPGEFARLTGKKEIDKETQIKMQRAMSVEHNIVVVLKGHYTSITTPDGRTYFNCTGNPGMATGGSGDVLTGIITGLLAQGYSSIESAIVGVYLHGLAGDLALESHSYETLLARDVVDHLPVAFREIYWT